VCQGGLVDKQHRADVGAKNGGVDKRDFSQAKRAASGKCNTEPLGKTASQNDDSDKKKTKEGGKRIPNDRSPGEKKILHRKTRTQKKLSGKGRRSGDEKDVGETGEWRKSA